MRLLFFLTLLVLSVFRVVAQDDVWGVINVSVCNTRSAAGYDAGMESQALLGMPVRVLDTHNEWTKIQTPEDYVHWTLSACVRRMTRQELSGWNCAPQVVVTSLYAFVRQAPSRRAPTVSDVVAGNRLLLAGRKGRYYKVRYPDGREGYLHKSDAMLLDVWRERLDNSSDGILSTARGLMGIPYMWGGTSPKGVDCSGFVRTVLYMHDIVIPRNASQQARKGLAIPLTDDFGHLLPGDLLFFGKKADDGGSARVQHVGIYMGGKRFIHSLGCVRIGSFDPADALYDEYDLKRLLSASRLLPYVNVEEGLFTTDKSEYYK